MNSKHLLIGMPIAALVIGGLAATAATAATAHPAKSLRPSVITMEGTPSFTQTICFGPTADGAILVNTTPPVALAPGQPVVVSASEASSGSGGEFIGAAPVYVENVSVLDGNVYTRIHTGDPQAINICLHYIG
jgi:hypothetical protein